MFTSTQLFSTLDPVIRRVSFDDGLYFFLSDTVGLIKKLPLELKTAFKATLEEASEADCLCHVIDTTSPHCASHIDAVDNILSDLGAADIPLIRVFNKIDLLDNKDVLLKRNQKIRSNSLYVSAKTGEGIPWLKDKFRSLLYKNMKLYYLKIPKSDKDTIASFPKWTFVLKQRDSKSCCEIKVLANPKSILKYMPYIQRGDANW